MRETTEPAPLSLSVIVPVYNSGRELEHCLTALKSSRFDGFDVLVVDDGSTEPIEPIAKRHGVAYIRIDGPQGPARARNRGAVRVAGEFVVFIDADVAVHEDTLSGFAAAFADNPGFDAVIGSYDDAPGDPGFFSQYKNIFHHYVHHGSHGQVPTFWSGCGAMRRSIFLQHGGFDDDRYRRPAIEDIELGTWISAAGHRVLLEPAIQCKHLKRWTFVGMLKSDVFERGIPWSRLMIRAGADANTLNVKGSQKTSVALVFLSLVAIAGTWWFPWAWGVAAALAAGVIAINRDFYRYFSAKRGWWFALRVVPLHYLYFVYCGACVIAGTLTHYLSGDSKGPPARRPLVDAGEV